MRRLLAALAIVAMTSAAIADEIVKKDGTVLKGEILREEKDAIIIKHELGEIRVPRAEIDRVSKEPKADIDGDLESVKRETVERLEALAAKADEAGLADKARALRALIAQVKAWTTKAESKPSKPSASKEPGEDLKTGGHLDLLKIREHFFALKGAERDEFMRPLHGKKARLKGVFEGAVYDPGDRETGQPPSLKLNAPGLVLRYGASDAELKKYAKLKLGETITVEGTIAVENGEPRLIGIELVSAR
jgi:hypothetical protein